ncbi:alpha/beta hydrolase family protein [Maribacter litoralis]|uniref:alpha/beta hydrolase family protein n=1 Tax=Maribacter litoralis TaxID=2059726 RepID=UPI0013DE985E|nr:hypothetical protein [Maribacter litoralis]
MLKIYNSILKWISFRLKATTLGKTAIKGASVGILIITAVLWTIYSINIYKKLNDPWIFLISLIIVFTTMIFSVLIKWSLIVLNKIPSKYFLAVLISFPLLSFMSFTLIAPVLILFFTSLCGAVILILKRTKFQSLSKTKKTITAFGLLLGFGGLTGLGVLYFQDGFHVNQLNNASKSSKINIQHINAISPSKEGSFLVKKLTYGSGKDLNQSEFGIEVDIKTEAVNGTPFINNWTGFGGWWRKNHFGFDSKSLPINARVWYPEGIGPFPLTLIVHGNHDMQDYSDSGYNYLGELLASKGIIVASVDENFLNESWSNKIGGLTNENDARGWILLEHLKVWHNWNNMKDNPFYKKLDTSNLALIGHSRGGEAVAHAALFNKLPYYPDDATVKFNYNYNIKSIAAIAPVDGQYKPGNSKTYLEDINYFVIHGSHDADVSSYMGSQQYERISFKDSLYHFKAGLYIYGANHGQFNESWGENDTDNPFTGLLNLNQLITSENQKKITQVYISAFIDITLKNKKEYLPLFVDARKGSKWLPETIFLNQFEDSNLQVISNFDEDFDVSTTTCTDGIINTKNLSVWREQEIQLKWQKKGSKALFLGWNYNDVNIAFESIPDSLIASYNINFPSMEIDSTTALVFSMAESKESAIKITQEIITDKTAKQKKKKDNIQNNVEVNELINFTIQLTDTDGQNISFPLCEFSFLQEEIEVKLMKSDFFNNSSQSEKVFQTFYFPIKEYLKFNPSLNLTQIENIKFIFDKNDTGVVVIDNIGFIKKL